VLWPLGDYERAQEAAQQAIVLAEQRAHPPTLAFVQCLQVLWEMMRGYPENARPYADALLATARQHGLSLFEGLGAAYLSCAEGRPEDTHRALIALHERGTRCIFTSMCKSFLAAMEARAGHLDVALATIDDAIEETRHTDHRSHNAESYRIRGEILLKRDAADPTPAEEAFLTAIAIAQQQKAKSFELRAALSLAKLYRNTDRTADAHAILAPALEGFSSTPEFPEIAEAQTLLAALAS
jgi:ATP/maltotriose-dependent transcriptional regulator MalT